MNMLLCNELKKRIRILEKAESSIRKSLEAMPPGTLRVCATSRGVQYYHRREGRKNGGIYISKKDEKLIHLLAQKDYNKRALKAIEKELRVLCAVCRQLEGDVVETVYRDLSDVRKLLVDPVILDDEQYVKEWQGQEFDRKGFPEDYPEYFSNRGERVRSKSEILIANVLDRMGIPYHYEKPLAVNEYLTLYPDFTIMNPLTRKEYYLEHLGMMDNAEYVEMAMDRLLLYENSDIFPGDRLLITHETSKKPLNVRTLEEMFKAVFLQ